MSESESLRAQRQAAANAFQQGRFGEALAAATAALQEAPHDYDALNLAVMAALHGERQDVALTHATTLAAAYPDDAYANNSHGAALQVAGRVAEAGDAYERATRLAPEFGDAWLNLGLCRLQGNDLLRAVAALERAAALQPANINATANLAVARTLERLASDDPTGAVLPATEAARVAPQSADLAGFAATAELDSGHDFDAARAHYARALQLEPQATRWRFQQALAWPPMLRSREQAERRMADVHGELDALLASPGKLADPFREVRRTPFPFAYAGLDDTALQRKIADAYRGAAPSLEWRAPHVDRPPPGFRRIRLGVLSAHLCNHTIGKLNIGLVQHFDRRRFELVVIRPPRPPDELAGFFDEAAGAAVTLPNDLSAAREKVASLELDAIFYPDVGMDPFTYFLAYARLARFQFTTWGHPVTTGMPNIDAFVSTRHAEPHDGVQRYHELLVEFDNLPSFYHPPRLPSEDDMRARHGIGARETLYVCPQTLFKLHPDQDAALCEILRRDARGVLVLIASRHPAWNETLRARLSLAGPDVIGRVRFIPAMSMPDFFALVRQADAVLDTFWFGGGNSSYEAFGLGRPVVTLPAPTMRGRVTLAWCTLMGEHAWVASSSADYVEKAVRLANDADARRESIARIEAGARNIIGSVAVVREYEELVARGVRR